MTAVCWLLATSAPAAETAGTSESEAALGKAWRTWAYSRPIEVGAEAARRKLVRIEIPEAVLAGSDPELSDLRIIDDAGREIGFAQHWNPGRDDRERLRFYETELLDTGRVPGGYTQAVADTGDDARVHDVAVIELLDRRLEFFAWTEIASSADYETWRVLRSRAPAYHFRETRGGEALRLNYPPTRDRWLRLRFERDGDEVPIAGIRVGKRPPAAATELEPSSELELELQGGSPADQSWWEARSARGTSPIAGLRFETALEEFYRPVKISTSEDGKTWDEIARGQVYRFLPAPDGDETTQEKVQLEFRTEAAKAWRVAVIDGNDAPIRDLRIELLRAEPSVVFRPEPGARYRLLYGNSRAGRPAYELARLVDRRQRERAPLGSLGAERRNPGFVDSEPFTERHPILIWTALVLAVAVLGGLAVRSLRSGSRAD